MLMVPNLNARKHKRFKGGFMNLIIVGTRPAGALCYQSGRDWKRHPEARATDSPRSQKLTVWLAKAE